MPNAKRCSPNSTIRVPARSSHASKDVGTRAASASYRGPRPRQQSIVTTSVAGKTLGRVIPTHTLETTRAPTAECQRPCKPVAELIAVGDEACQASAQATPPFEHQE